jgi:hypothetical protein
MQTPKERASVENGIYLCRTCADRIDKDAARFTADMLHDVTHRRRRDDAQGVRSEAPFTEVNDVAVAEDRG